MRKINTKTIVPLYVVPERRTKRCSPRFRPGGHFGAKFQIPVARQGGREMSAPRPCVTNPFHLLSSVNSHYQLLHIQNSVVIISHIWYIQVCLDTVYIQQLRMHSYRSKSYKARVIIYASLCSLLCSSRSVEIACSRK